MAGFKVHAVGVILMIAGITGVATSVMFWNTWGGFNRARSGDTVRIDRVVSFGTLKLEGPLANAMRQNDPLARLREET